LKTFLLAVAVIASAQISRAADLRTAFADPPADCRIMMRWWWFGPAVTKQEIARELHVMQAAGIGGVEIQPVYPLALDNPKTGFKNLPYLSSGFLDALSFASQTARQLGMRVDITLGSGWPYGGPLTPITQAAGRLRIEHSALLPALENGESLVASFADQQLFFIASRTGQQVKRASVGAEGFVLDHYDRSAIESHLAQVGDRLLSAFGDHPPYAVFSDSLEVYGSDWTADLPQEFKRRRGYDLVPHLPELLGNTEAARNIRHDWGKTLTELAEERYLAPIAAWAHRHHTLFRSQTYGEPPVILSSNALVDLSEGEAGPQWRAFNTARWAASANHLYGRNITSTETWTWLHAPSFRATPLDMKAEADLHFIEGVNQLIGHGWPYSPPQAGEPGWRFYAAAAFNEHNPWFQVMPEITRYLQRISFLARQGKPVNDIAIYLPTDDAWAAFTPGKTSVDKEMETLLGPALIPQILNAGYNFDYIDDRALAQIGVPYRVLILPGVERMPPQTIRRLEEFIHRGGSVIETRSKPILAARFVADERQLGAALREVLPPDLEVSRASAPVIGFTHRKLTDGDMYFVVNTSNAPVETTAHFRAQAVSAQRWDPFTGKTGESYDASELRLAPYESRVIVFSKDFKATPQHTPSIKITSTLDLSTNWEVTFNGLPQPVQMQRLHSWTDDQATRFYSGDAIYRKAIEIPAAFSGKTLILDFGQGEGVAPPRVNVEAAGMRALLESPVRESALVYVNGKPAGSVWHPPYQLNLTKWLHPGSNTLRIDVANLAVNEMAGRALPDYKLLNQRYGVRFVPQGFENFHALPAGILGHLQLLVVPNEAQ
jgi:hypothetical protein